ncbi:MAG: putative lipid II flippase FtsW [Deltaproteobacteria bacterium]|nr:putative lipid II flippase FtsW [Deltaproteobacteria bacterium]
MAKKLAFDKMLFTSVVALASFGLVMVYSASAAIARDLDPAINPFLVKQTLAAGVGLIFMATAMHIDYQILRRKWLVYALLGGIVVLLVAVLFSPAVNNARRWFFLGGISVQPSELAKLVLIPFLAYQIDRKWDRINQAQCLVPCLAIVGLLAGLLLLEPDMGTAVLLMTTAAVMLFLAGLAWRYVVTAFALSIPMLYLLVTMAPYRARRLGTFLRPDDDPLGSGFQISQSLIAVGSGGFSGLGLGQSLQKLYYLPHPHSDFVFSIVCEELGMIGALCLLALFGALIARGIRAGLRAPDRFGAFLAWGFTALLGIQALTHISVSLSLLPTKGIPLPFVSYGGSSLVSTLTAAGVILNVSQHG